MAMDEQKIQATVVLMKKSLKEHNDLGDIFSGFVDRIQEFVGQNVSLRLVSADKIDRNPKNELGVGKIGPELKLEEWNSKPVYSDVTFHVTFDSNKDFGTPGAILVKNPYHGEFFLKTVTLEDVPSQGEQIHFFCNSWIYQNQKERIFFSNKTYLPHEMPGPLRKFRDIELEILRGDGEGELKEWDRVYDYAFYNDLGDPDNRLNGSNLTRPVLGGSFEYPYPRRARTGRKPSKSDPKSESKYSGNIYVPRDEHFERDKQSDFDADFLQAQFHAVIPLIEATINLNALNEFQSFEEIDDIYGTGIHQKDGNLLKYPVPQLIQKDKTAWKTDEEFAREMLAGVNPVLIRLLKEFPPTSGLDSEVYHSPNSRITENDIKYSLDGLEVREALERKRLFILDHHDTVIPYLSKIHENTQTSTYASRTLLFLKDDNTLKPVAIELSLPVPLDGDKEKSDIESKVYIPAEDGVEGFIWQLAKAYVAVVDTGHHQLISHWLNTHATIEPFVIATHRQLSAVHPIYKLLHPHYRDTMAINALARETLINADGIIEKAFYPGKYSMEMSSVIYRSWNFLDQALPNDLKKRGLTISDIKSLDDLDKLVIKDYPYAVDGLKIWFAIEKWVRDYCSFYYKTNEMVQQDNELQAWWKELREVGHGDKKDEPWWPKMQTREELIESCTIIIWTASALHAAVNFGQYAYGGYLLNRPTTSRKLMPNEDDLKQPNTNFEKVFLETITQQDQSLIGLTAIEILSQQSSDEKYLGERDDDPDNWTTDSEPQESLKAFQKRLAIIEEEIINMNMKKELKNRFGLVKVPYTLLYPKGEAGLHGKGIPNSISI